MQYSEPLSLEHLGDPNVVWRPLKIDGALANTDEDIARNIESALCRDYIPYNRLIGTKSGAVAVVGSGPSLKSNWQELQDFDGEIVACNASCQFLLGKGITPTYMLCFDADPLMLEFITPNPAITYLIGSRCPPKTFDMLKGHRVVCWHAAGDTNIQELLEKHGKMEPMITGGSAAVTRAMILVVSMGYTSLHLYGADSSHIEGDTHIRKSTTDEREMHLMCNERVFKTSPWMAKQAEDFKILLPTIMKHFDRNVFVHGDGLIPHIAKELGCRTDYETRSQQFAREWTNKARYLWSQL